MESFMRRKPCADVFIHATGWRLPKRSRRLLRFLGAAELSCLGVGVASEAFLRDAGGGAEWEAHPTAACLH